MAGTLKCTGTFKGAGKIEVRQTTTSIRHSLGRHAGGKCYWIYPHLQVGAVKDQLVWYRLDGKE